VHLYNICKSISITEWSQMGSIFTAVFEKAGDCYIGYVEELPGANTQGKTLDEARENLREAIKLILSSNRELAGRKLSGKEYIREEIEVAI